MGVEIERKFLVIGDSWQSHAGAGCRLRQGYLGPSSSGAQVRVRCASDRAFLTIKGRRNGCARAEFEYEIPYDEAELMLNSLCLNPPLEKTRYTLEDAGSTWVIDVFSGTFLGLIVAEIELNSVDQIFDRPNWLGEEVTHLPQYRNAVLSEQTTVL